MPDDPISGHEPALPAEAGLTGNEPSLGGDSRLSSLLSEVERSAEPDEALVMRIVEALPQVFALLNSNVPRHQDMGRRLIQPLVAAGFPGSSSTRNPVVDALYQAVYDNDWPAAVAVTTALGHTALRWVAEVLIDQLVEPSSRATRQAAVASLARLGDVALVALMDAVTRTPEPSLYARARLYDALMVMVRSSVYRPVAQRLSEWITPLVLSQQIALDVHEARLLVGALNHLPLIDGLLAIAQDRAASSVFRTRAVRALAFTPDPRVAELMLELMAGDERFLRAAAAQTLCRVRRREDVPRIVEMIGHSDPQICRLAMRVASIRRIKAGTPAILAALGSDHMEVRRDAVVALSRYRSPETVPALLAALSDSRAEVRRAAVRAVGRFRDAAMLPPLLDMLRDRARPVRQEAISTLWRLRRQFPGDAGMIEQRIQETLRSEPRS